MARDSRGALLFNAVATALGVVTGIIVAKAFGPDGKGEFSGLQLLQSGFGAVTAGVGSSITYYLTKGGRRLSDIAWPLAAMLLVVTTVVAGGLAVWGWRFGYNDVLLFFAIAAPAVIFISWQSGLLLGLDQIRSLNVQTLGLAAFTLLAVGASVLLHLGVVGAMAAWTVCLYGATLVLTRRLLAALDGRPTVAFGQSLRDLTSFGSRSALFGVLGFLNYRIDSLVLVAFLGASGYGVYSVAVAAGELLFRIPRAISSAITFRVGSASFEESAATTAKAIRISAAAVAVVGVGLYVTVPWLVAVLYGPRFAGAVAALRILLPGIFAYSSMAIFNSFYVLQLGRPMFVVYLSLIMIAVQTTLAVLLVPRIGLNGAALASTATYVFATVVLVWNFQRLTGLSPAAVWVVRRDDLRSLRQLVQRDVPAITEPDAWANDAGVAASTLRPGNAPPLPADAYTLDRAIKVTSEDVASDSQFEYTYVRNATCGTNGHWMPVGETIFNEKRRTYIRIAALCPSTGETRNFYFDITGVFGKGER
jgi:O-antigen/teichoic acid export membrane protein